MNFRLELLMLIVMENVHTLVKHLNALTVRAVAGKCSESFPLHKSPSFKCPCFLHMGELPQKRYTKDNACECGHA